MQVVKNLEKMPYALLLILFAAVAVTTFDSNFLFIDDVTLIVNNPRLHFSFANLLSIFMKPLGQIFDASDNPLRLVYYRPALNLLYMLNSTIWGINPVGFHISNLLLHFFTTLIVYRCALLLFKDSISLSLLAAALFCVHPVHNELIGRVAMNENLLGFFMASSFYFYLQSRNHMALFAFVLALLSKESAVMLPFVIFLFELSNKQVKDAARFLSPYLLVTALYLLIRTAVVGLPDEMSSVVNLFGQPFLFVSALAAYTRLLIFPYPLSIYYPVWTNTPLNQSGLLLALSICILLACFAWRYKADKQITSLLFGTLLLLAPVVLKANKLILGSDRAFVAERQLYVPAIFFSLLVAAVLNQSTSNGARKYLFALAVCVVAVFAAVNPATTAVWKSTERVVSIFIQHHPDSFIAHRYKGEVLLAEGKLDAAMVEFKAALPAKSPDAKQKADDAPQAIAKGQNLASLLNNYNLAEYQPEYAIIHYNIAMVFLAKNDTESAMKKLKTVLVLMPHYVEARTVLAGIYMQKRMFKDASREYKLALKDIAAYRLD